MCRTKRKQEYAKQNVKAYRDFPHLTKYIKSGVRKSKKLPSIKNCRETIYIDHHIIAYSLRPMNKKKETKTKVLTNEKRGGFKMVSSFDRSCFELFTGSVQCIIIM